MSNLSFLVDKDKKIFHLQVKRVFITKSVLSVSVLPTQTHLFPLHYHAKAKQLSIPSFFLCSPHFPYLGAAKRWLQCLSNVPVSFQV